MIRNLIYSGALLFSVIGVATLVQLLWGSLETYRAVKRQGITGVRRLLARRNLCAQATHLSLMVLFTIISIMALSVGYDERTPLLRFVLLVAWLAMWGLLVMSGLLAARVQREIDSMLTTDEEEGEGR